METSIRDQLKTTVQHYLQLEGAVSDEVLKQFIEEEVLKLGIEHALSASSMHLLVERTFHSFRGLDVLEPLLQDPTITEIMINSFDEIYVEQEGKMTLVSDRFESEERLEDIIQSIVGKVNRVVNESTPIVDARLHDGSRVNVVLPPIALKGPAMTIRKFPESPMTIEQLIEFGTLTAEVAGFLKTLVEARYNIFIGGGTGSGKTTLLNALSNFIPADERMITIEDSAELQINRVPNIVRMETRNANTEGKGEITIRDLIRTSLRMRPNRIVVGEVRGAEAFDMLMAMNTGHDGSLSTGHANSVKDMLSRLETMVLSAAPLPLEAIRAQICSAIDVMIHLSRLRDRTRRITEICEVINVQEGQIVVHPLYRFEEEGEDENGKIIGQLKRTEHAMFHTLKLQLAGIPWKEDKANAYAHHV